MTHSERIERIARAMADVMTTADGTRGPLTDEEWADAHGDEARELIFPLARAAYLATLESLREPSEAMCDACDAADAETGYRARPVPLWRAMIDAAIKEAE